MKPLLIPYLHRKRIKAIISYANGDVLDLGCGPATIAKYLDDKQRYVEIDIAENRIDELKKKYPRFEFYCCNLDTDTIDFLKGKFDTIVLTAIIEHLEKPEFIIQQCYNMLKKKGIIVITTPTPIGGKVHLICSKFGLVSKSAVEHHHQFFSKSDIKKLLDENGFHITRYNSFELFMNQIIIGKRRCSQ